MDVTDLDLCVVLPIAALEAWVRAEPSERASWLSRPGVVSQVDVGGATALVFRRERPRPTKALVATEARKRVSVVVSGAEDAARAAIDAPTARTELAPRVTLASGLLVIGGDLAHADVGGGTPVAGPHRIVDLAPGDYRIEMRAIGTPGEPGFARVISFEPYQPT
jgi:hypothetical protein